MKYTQIYPVRFSETDHHGTATPVALFNCLQDTAIAHSVSLGGSAVDLARRNLAWMMNRIHIRFLRYPALNEDLRVTTWTHRLHGLYAIREWCIEGERGDAVHATGRWIMFETARQRIIRIPPDFAETFGELEERVIDDPFERMAFQDGASHRRTFHVRMSDLDSNQHANSACYVDWCLEAVPPDIVQTHRPRSLEITFKKESRLGEGIVSTAQNVPGETGGLVFEHEVRGEAEATCRALARTRWAASEAFEPL